MSIIKTEVPPYKGVDTTVDDLDFGRVLQIFLRTWPFIKPLTRHLIYFVACSAGVFLFTTTLGLIIIGLVNSGIIAGKPLGLFHAAIYGVKRAGLLVMWFQHLATLGRVCVGYPYFYTLLA